MADDLKAVLTGDFFLKPLDLVRTELDDTPRIDIDEMVMVLLFRGFVARPSICKDMTFKNTLVLKQFDGSVDSGKGNARVDLCGSPV